MLDQMFTEENFRRIFDSENRKGVNLAGRFFPNLDSHTQAIRKKVAEIRTLRSEKELHTPDEVLSKVASLKEELALLKASKSRAINKELESVSLRARKPSFKLALTQKQGPKGKLVFCINESPEAFFVNKQLQSNICKIYDVKQANRHQLAAQLRDTITSSFPFEVVRTDVSSFYETIDREKLLKRLDQDQLLSSSSKKYIRQVLEAYRTITRQAVGIPRGVGISAYLAEFYMRRIDREIKAIPGLILYCRFVDDIVAVFARPHEGEALGPYESAVIKVLAGHGLTQNVQKTKELALGGKKTQEFEYLGYRFILGQGMCAVRPSEAKLQKYETRMNAAFFEYESQSSVNPRRAYRELVSRIKFLTGNTRLVNSKSSAVTGIYYNNPMVTEPTSFEHLDKLLKAKVKGIKRPMLRKRLKDYKFTQGFVERRFHKFSAQELQRIVEAWKHA
ncbi:antiviral reverse transcriptase Drt3a [Granulicella sp. S156]|uniref:antiviral reverse transcriptase Drt3a n=1 Tax=Granulicella sp. S156 TaxID=1747224 RepID=UPI00157553EA|nr:antiviral reverse transcriptase Drt3a [Granulicella sp. S156]